ncbi:MAG: NADH-dependent [FeFe] hydrogenase, group A6 [bacterium]
METVTLKIDGKEVTVEKGLTILEAARRLNIHIPTLCYLKDVQAIGACRMCLVEIQGQRALQASCVFPVAEGLVVKTNSAIVREARRAILELLLSDHRMECPTCARNLSCELQALAEQYGIREISYKGDMSPVIVDRSSPSLVRDSGKCILCRRCVAVCQEIQKVGVLFPSLRGFNTTIAPAFSDELSEVACVYCGQCSLACPVGAIVEKDDIQRVWDALTDPNKFVVVQTAPAIRAAIGEEFGLEPGHAVTGKMTAALRRLGFDKVFDTQFTADLTIIEEGHELINRVKNGGTLPLITSCSPGWIKFIEHFYPDLLPHLSTCKSPQQMFGAVAKTYLAEKVGKKPEEMVVVSIMPCTAKKFEAARPEMDDSGVQDVDIVLTTREAARMIKQAGINLLELEDEMFDDPLGESTGAGTIFAATGGVMEAALRTVYEVVTKGTLPSLDFESVRGMEGVKAATVQAGDLPVKVAVAHGLGNARKVMDEIQVGKADYHFIEIMCCPGGCLGGGGQPIPTNWEIRNLRAKAVYEEDRRLSIRKSHENPFIKKIYEEFLVEPLGEKSHHLLHTHYTKRGAA